MSGPSTPLRTADGAALSLLCLILAGSVAMRVYMYGTVGSAGPSDGRGPIDLGHGVLLPWTEAVSRTVPIPPCRAAATVQVVEPSPHGADTSLDAPPNPADRMFYAYHGQTFGGRFAAMELSALYFSRRSLGLFRLPGGVEADDLAVKVIVPAGCDATPEDVTAALRREASRPR